MNVYSCEKNFCKVTIRICLSKISPLHLQSDLQPGVVNRKTEGVAQLVRASDCGSEGRGFDPHLSPSKKPDISGFFYVVADINAISAVTSEGKNNLILVPFCSRLCIKNLPPVIFSRSRIIR